MSRNLGATFWCKRGRGEMGGKREIEIGTRGLTKKKTLFRIYA